MKKSSLEVVDQVCASRFYREYCDVVFNIAPGLLGVREFQGDMNRSSRSGNFTEGQVYKYLRFINDHTYKVRED